VCLRMLRVNGCCGVGLVSVSYIFRSGISGAGVLMYGAGVIRCYYRSCASDGQVGIGDGDVM